jgi:hypothetical protein
MATEAIFFKNALNIRRSLDLGCRWFRRDAWSYQLHQRKRNNSGNEQATKYFHRSSSPLTLEAPLSDVDHNSFQ